MEVVDASAKDSSQKADQINTATQLTIATVEEVYTSIVFNNAKNIFDSMGKAAEIFLGGAEIVIGRTLELGSLPLGVIAGIGTFGVTGGSALSISPALVAGTATAVVAKNAGATLVENGNIHLSQANGDAFSSSEKGSNGSNVPVPNEVEASNGLMYKSNPKHTLGGAGNRPNAGIEPSNSMELFEKSITSNKKFGVRFAYDEQTNTLHRFFSDKNGEVWHWSGSTNQGINSLSSKDIPIDVLRHYGISPKGW